MILQYNPFIDNNLQLYSRNFSKIQLNRLFVNLGLIDKIQATIDISTYKDIALVNLKAMNKKVLLLWLSKNQEKWS